MLRMSSITVHILVKLFVKLRTALLIGPSEKRPISSPVQLVIQKLFWASEEGFKKASSVAPQLRYLYSVQIWRIIRWPLFFFKHLRTVLMEALLRDMCNVCRAPCILLNSVPSGSSRLHSSVNFWSRNYVITVCKNINTNITSQRRKHPVKLA